ncbi:WYL domain-containing protein [uncultured Aquitalea sp.]|uniref:helix-turn-helix transcriptional regulator n=1 Tax=uncultured Aquitalea sp. TaxID=540272 RepID=UPI0025E7C030|nr:WYL domain-containing protein [uncultured Aquitalea sp.]
MRRADRLMEILLLLRGRRRTTASQLAQWLEVSPRTVYRDMADLMASGAPVNGEAGEGYWLEAGFQPPPLSFSAAELSALEAAARMLAAWADPDTAGAAASALAKIHAVLGSSGLPPTPLYAPALHDYPCERLTPLAQAIRQGQWLDIAYQDENGRASQRRVAPLGLFFWGDRWTLAAWCALRRDYRHFRVDRLTAWATRADPWPAGISLDAFLENAQAGHATRQKVARQNQQPWHRS